MNMNNFTQCASVNVCVHIANIKACIAFYATNESIWLYYISSNEFAEKTTLNKLPHSNMINLFTTEIDQEGCIGNNS